MAEVSSRIVKDDRMKLRQKLPLKMHSIVEKDLGDNRYLVSNADSTFSVKFFNRKIIDAFTKAKQADRVKRPKLEEIEAGQMYLYHKSDVELHRVEALNKKEDYVMVRFIDYGTCDAIRYENLVSVDVCDFEEICSVEPFVRRVNLPPNEILLGLGLPTSSMIRVGDFVDVTLLTSSDPHLAVFGLSRSETYRVKAEKLVDGFTPEEKVNWQSLFDNKEMYLGASILPDGFSNLRGRDFHNDRLAFISFVKKLDKVYVHDLESSLRLSLMRDRLAMLYGNKKSQKQYVIDCEEDVNVGAGVVAWHKQSESYIRVVVVAAGIQTFEVAPVDSPNFGCFDVEKKDLYKVPKSLVFPRQSFAVRMIRPRECASSFSFDALARNLLPDKTVVVLQSEPKLGLTKIICASAPNGVLAKIGFIAAGDAKFEKTKNVVDFAKSFGGAEKLAVK